MKKIFFLLAIIMAGAISSMAQSQPAQSYLNLEKYWFYRYRLVNDFMLIGDGPGMSMPASSRIRGDSPVEYEGQYNNNSLKWGDATVDLGHYISTLATEYRMLKDQNMDTWRTEYELDKAIGAIERLDKTAEEYCDEVNNNINPPLDRSGYPGILKGYNGNPGTPTYPYTLNGFFIRDDVPFYDFVSDNWKHFNRPAMNNPVNSLIPSPGQYHYYGGCPTPTPPSGYCDAGGVSGSAFDGTYLGMLEGSFQGTNYNIPGLEDHILVGYPSVPNMPTEESQDQLADIFLGLALTERFVNNTDLRTRASEEIWQSIYHASGETPIPSWKIKNPYTGKCAYGISPQSYGTCNAGGSDFSLSSSPGSLAAYMMHPNGASHSLELQANFPFNIPYMFYQLSQGINSDPAYGGIPPTLHSGITDLVFQDGYAAFANNYIISCNQILIPNFLAFLDPCNNTFNTLVLHSISDDFGSPHIPLIYKWNFPDGTVGFTPEDGYAPYLNTHYASYEGMLNDAPTCGIHNYEGHWGNSIEWSGNDRLSEPYHRKMDKPWGEGDPTSRDADFNNLDYMMLFNLYAHVKSNYLNTMINPYYTRNFNLPFPDIFNIGSTSKKLQLNYLEYLSLIDKIGDDGNITFRGGKSIECLPGFDAKPGNAHAMCLIYIKDYSCDDGPYNYATETVTHHTHSKGDDDTEIVDSTFDIQYNPTYTPYDTTITYPIIDTTLDNYGLDTTGISQYNMDSVINYIHNNWQNYDTDEINQLINIINMSSDTSWHVLLPVLTGLERNAPPAPPPAQQTALVADAHLAPVGVNVFPNPNEGSFKVTISMAGDYSVSVSNAVGQAIYKGNMKNESEKIVQLPYDIAPGSYLITIIGDKVNYNATLILTK